MYLPILIAVRYCDRTLRMKLGDVMYAFYGQKQRHTIGYVKMYSTFCVGDPKRCFQCILMPYGHERERVNLQSIQFFFSASGKVRRVSICYLNLLSGAMEKVAKTIDAVVPLKKKYGVTSNFYTIDENTSTLNIGGIGGLMPLSFLKELLVHLKVSYLISEECMEELRSLLLSPQRLAKEYARLRGPVTVQEVPVGTPCIMM